MFQEDLAILLLQIHMSGKKPTKLLSNIQVLSKMSAEIS